MWGQPYPELLPRGRPLEMPGTYPPYPGQWDEGGAGNADVENTLGVIQVKVRRIRTPVSAPSSDPLC